MTGKTLAREHGKAVRAKLAENDRHLLDQRIVERCEAELQWTRFERVDLFLPIPKRCEINTWPLLSWIWRNHPRKLVFVPRMLGSEIEHVFINDQTFFGPNALGIPEPMQGKILGEDEKIDLIITPLLAFDDSGYRVGYGGGYYDRFLAEHPEAIRVGLGYENCLIGSGIEIASFDVPLDLVVTEDRLHRFSTEQ